MERFLNNDLNKIIIAENLTKRFNGFTAVDDVSFSVGTGEVFGFLGPNGAGKTTTISMLCSLLKITSGSATIAGYDVSKKPMGVRQSIGLIFQDPSLDEKLTAIENMRFHGRIYNVNTKEREKRIDELLEMLSLNEWRKTIVKKFSGGMKRRLEIARGLLHSPKVLFLDEPTIGLDPQTRKKIWEYLNKLRSETGITLFLTTHYMDEAENCTSLAVIDHGKIIATGSPAELKSDLAGDVIQIGLEQPDDAQKILKDKYGFASINENGKIRFEVKDGEQFLPEFLRSFPLSIKSVSLNKPTLEDVFIKLTGRAIREVKGDAMETMRTFHRATRR